MSELASMEIDRREVRSIVRDQPLGRGIVPATFEEATKLANALYQTGCFGDMKNASEAVAKVIVGSEFGFSAAFSMMNVYVFKGNIGMEYPAMAAVIKRAGYRYRVIEQTAKKCSIQFIDPDGNEPGPPVEFSAEDAAAAGTQNMARFPKAMLFARAMSMGCRMYCADAFAGAVYSRDEIQSMEYEAEAPALPTGAGSSERLAAKIKGKADDSYDPFPDEAPDTFAEEAPMSEEYDGERVMDGVFDI